MGELHTTLIKNGCERQLDFQESARLGSWSWKCCWWSRECCRKWCIWHYSRLGRRSKRIWQRDQRRIGRNRTQSCHGLQSSRSIGNQRPMESIATSQQESTEYT